MAGVASNQTARESLPPSLSSSSSLAASQGVDWERAAAAGNGELSAAANQRVRASSALL